MADSGELSRIVGLIMENPALVQQISALAKGESNADEVQSSEQDRSSVATENTGGSNRARLIAAIKPYLSEKRTKAVDTLLSVSEVLGAVRGKG